MFFVTHGGVIPGAIISLPFIFLLYGEEVVALPKMMWLVILDRDLQDEAMRAFCLFDDKADRSPSSTCRRILGAGYLH